ncbi:MAG: hypothetical protein BRC31_00405 [Actinobacteria bacterium QS_5_72_10]|nr:MAG: hypothetical protein BRC31_00405 [Actinobacteria bacterium QS_5_72_10]
MLRFEMCRSGLIGYRIVPEHDDVDRDRLDWALSEGSDPESAIVSLADEFDLVVLGETKPSLRDRIIGTVLTPILDGIEKPVIVVRDTAGDPV